eukprot:1159198-Pelagomonas_calceolata.AAC.2
MWRQCMRKRGNALCIPFEASSTPARSTPCMKVNKDVQGQRTREHCIWSKLRNIANAGAKAECCVWNAATSAALGAIPGTWHMLWWSHLQQGGCSRVFAKTFTHTELVKAAHRKDKA